LNASIVALTFCNDCTRFSAVTMMSLPQSTTARTQTTEGMPSITTSTVPAIERTLFERMPASLLIKNEHKRIQL
jgi:hypothetical protein